jgi:membrane dipeptidase
MIVDCHNDTILKVVYGGEDFGRASPNLHVDLPKIRSIGSAMTLFFAAWVDPVFPGAEAFAQAVKLLGRIRDLAEHYRGEMGIATDVGTVERLGREGRTAVVLSVEGGQAINDDPGNIERLYESGARLLTLSHNESPRWVGSCAAAEDRGLDSVGKNVVETMNRVGMIVDVAHASEQSIRDVARASSHPIVSSHSAARAVFDISRGLSDDAIRCIADTGGVIGIMFYPGAMAPMPEGMASPSAWIMAEFTKINSDPGLSTEEKAARKIPLIAEGYPKPDRVPGVEVVVDHIDHVVRLVGEDSVAIGSDFDGVPYSFHGLEHIGKLGSLVEEMRSRGYSDESIEGILGRNMLRVMKAVIG